VQKLRYVHRNPVKAGLCERAEDWEWSSFRHMRPGSKDGWRLNRSGPPPNANGQQGDCVCRSNYPTQANRRLEWATLLLRGVLPLGYLREPATERQTA
jgi:hypothetical protein